jgi:integrase
MTLATIDRTGLATTGAEGNPVAAYLASLGSEVSRASMRSNLERVARMLEAPNAEAVPWHAMKPAHVAALAARLADAHSPSTANVTLSALRGVFRAAWNLGLMDRETLERLTRDANGKTHRVRGNTAPTGRHLEAGELAALFRAAAADPYATRGARDAALLAILDGGGLRRAEAVALDLADVDLDVEAVTIRRGKGRKARTVPLAAGAGAALSAWLAVRGDAPGPLFVAVNKGGRLGADRLPVRGVARILDRLAAAANVAAFTAHDFRRTVAGDLLDAGADIVTVQALLGHANPQTTARYDRRPAEARRKAARLRAVPYRAAA